MTKTASELNKIIGKRIKDRRKELKLTQKELADRLDVTRSLVGQYERGVRNPKPSTLQRIADALGISVTELLPESADQTPEKAFRSRVVFEIDVSDLSIPELAERLLWANSLLVSALAQTNEPIDEGDVYYSVPHDVSDSDFRFSLVKEEDDGSFAVVDPVIGFAKFENNNTIIVSRRFVDAVRSYREQPIDEIMEVMTPL